jgi:hypothetical protein
MVSSLISAIFANFRQKMALFKEKNAIFSPNFREIGPCMGASRCRIQLRYKAIYRIA